MLSILDFYVIVSITKIALFCHRKAADRYYSIHHYYYTADHFCPKILHTIQKDWMKTKKKKKKKVKIQPNNDIVFRLRSLTFGVYFNSTQYSLNFSFFFLFSFSLFYFVVGFNFYVYVRSFVRSVNLSAVCHLCRILTWLMCIVYVVLPYEGKSFATEERHIVAQPTLHPNSII